MDVLLFGTMGRIGEVVRDSLLSHGLGVSLVGFGQNVFRDEPGYRRELVKAVLEYHPDAVMPIGNAVAMSRWATMVRSGVPLRPSVCARGLEPGWEQTLRSVRYVVDTEANVSMLDSKLSCFDLAGSLGVLQPGRYHSAADVTDWDSVIFKRDVSFGGHGVHRPRSQEALANLIAHQSPGEPYLMEQYVEGFDCSLDMVRGRGGAFCSAYRTVASQGCGPSQQREVMDRSLHCVESMRSTAEAMLGHLDYLGVCGFDFRVDARGRAWLLECNPRFTGGIDTQLASGFDIPWLLLCEASEL